MSSFFIPVSTVYMLRLTELKLGCPTSTTDYNDVESFLSGDESSSGPSGLGLSGLGDMHGDS